MRTEPVFIGYFPKRAGPIPHGPRVPPQVVQLCNAGHCDGLYPKGWSDVWRHNEMWLYDSEALAWSVAPEAEWHAYEIHAYRIFPVVFTNGTEQTALLPPVQPEPMSADYECLGYDPVSFRGLGPGGESYSRTFGHSSLSPFCNGCCQSIAVNRFCLLDTLEEALYEGGPVPRDKVAAGQWIFLAAGAGDKDAHYLWREMELLLSPAELDGARKAAAAFKPVSEERAGDGE